MRGALSWLEAVVSFLAIVSNFVSSVMALLPGLLFGYALYLLFSFVH